MIGAFAFFMATLGLIYTFIEWARKDTDWSKTFAKGKTLEEIAAESRDNHIGEMDYYDFRRTYCGGNSTEEDKIIEWLCGTEGNEWKTEFSKQFGYSCLSTELLLMAIYALQGKVYFRVINGIYLTPKNTNYKIYKDFLLWYDNELKSHGIEGMYYLYRHGCVRNRIGGGSTLDYCQRMDKHFYNAMPWGKYAPSVAGDATIFWPSCADHTYIDCKKACDLY